MFQFHVVDIFLSLFLTKPPSSLPLAPKKTLSWLPSQISFSLLLVLRRVPPRRLLLLLLHASPLGAGLLMCGLRLLPRARWGRPLQRLILRGRQRLGRMGTPTRTTTSSSCSSVFAAV
jgi:hypothetical protein